MTIIVTSQQNILYQLVIPGGLTDAQLEGLKAGSFDPDDFAAIVPLPTLRLAIRAQGSNPPKWRLNLHHARPTDKPKPLTVPVLTADAEFRSALDTFHALATVALPEAAEADRLNGAALILGERLAAMLPVEERARFVELGRADGPPPFLVIESTDETVLGLPWELLRLENTWPVKDGRLDVARCYINVKGAVLQPPTGPLHMLLHVCAPANSGLNYEEESYRILRAVRESVAVTVNELGELGDLVGKLVQPNPPGVVHFSGHGAQGSLLFENETGGEAFVPAKQFLDELAKAGRVRLPRLFYLGCCHGQTPHANALASEPQVTSTAALLHREGFAQVIAHYGPVYDTQATSAEEAFYQKLAQGGRTRTALRAARHVLAQPFHVLGNEGRRDVEAGLLLAGSVPFAWALLVLYHRGPDHPLAPTNEGPVSIRPATPARHERDAFSGAKSRVLEHGFIGRRKELHEFRRRYEDPVDPHYVHVVHGLGGLGKSVFCQIARRLWDRDGRATINLWCYEVERHPLPVSGLLEQLLQQVDAWQLPGWEREVRMAQTQTADSPGLLLRLLAWLVQAWPRPGPRDAPSHVVVHLDNLESLICPPGTPREQAEDDDPAAIAPWRDGQCQRFWKGLTQLASNSGGRLLVLASTRYTNDDIRPADRFPFGPMPRDAMLRMMDWLPSLRRLSRHARDRLVPELAGHPFVAVHLATLVQAELERYEADHGPPALVTNEVAATEEWREFIEPLLVRCHGRLREHLLFDAVWRDVLREPERVLSNEV